MGIAGQTDLIGYHLLDAFWAA